MHTWGGQTTSTGKNNRFMLWNDNMKIKQKVMKEKSWNFIKNNKKEIYIYDIRNCWLMKTAIKLPNWFVSFHAVCWILVNNGTLTSPQCRFGGNGGNLSYTSYATLSMNHSKLLQPSLSFKASCSLISPMSKNLARGSRV